MIAKRLVELTADGDAEVRRAAVEALGRLGEQTPVEALLQALTDADWWVRQAAVEALGRLGEQTPVEALLQALTDADVEVRRAAVVALGGLGERAPVEALLQLLTDSNPWVRRAAAQVLGRLGERAPVEALLQMSTDSDAEVHRAVVALGGLGVEALLQMSTDADAEVRQAAVEALGGLGERAPVEALLQMFTDTSHNVRLAAVESMGERAPLSALVQAMQDSGESYERDSGEINVRPDKIRQSARSAVRERSRSEIERAGEAAALILSHSVADPSEVAEFAALWQTRVIKAIARIGLPHPEFIRRLSISLHWPHWQVRVAGAEALGALKRHIPVETINRLKALRNDPTEPSVVRNACDDALAEILSTETMEDDM